MGKKEIDYMDERLKKQLALEIDKEKNILRQTHLSGHGRNENDAEHAWHMAIMAYLLREYSNEPVDITRVMLMCLIHDVVEIDAGDTYAYDEEGKKTQKAREEAAKERIYSLLPEDQKEELAAIFDEFEESKTPESKFAHAMDNLQPLMLNNSNDGGDWREHGVSAKQVYGRQDRTKEGSEKLYEITEQIIKKYQKQDYRIKLYSLLNNQGVANARNTAIQNTRGRYLAFLDSDDMWLPEKLEKQLAFMQANNYVFTYHDYRTIMVKDNTLGKIIHVPIKVNYEKLLKGNSTGSCLSTCIDRNVVTEVYMPNDKHEDFICWLNVLKKYGIVGYGISECLAYYRVGKKSVSSNKFKSAMWTWKVYRDSQKLTIMESIRCFGYYVIGGISKYL